MRTNSRERALRQAAHWYARLERPDCSEKELAEFERWRCDPINSGAYASARRLSDAVAQLASTDHRLRAMAEEAHAMGRGDGRPAVGGGPERTLRGPRRRVGPWAGITALAASLIAAVGVAWLVATPKLEVYATGAGEHREIVLTDQSTVRLDVGSELRVRITSSERRVELVKGRAIFHVAHDPSRPFAVIAGTGTVTALGTRFQVQRTGPQVLVTLAEGAVSVSGPAVGVPRAERLEPGEQLVYSDDALGWSKARVDTRAATSWSEGRHVFRELPLADALNEVNRYVARKVRLGDAALAEMPVSGTFIAGDSELIVAAFAAVLPIRMIRSDSEIVLFTRYEPDAQ